MDNNEIMKPIIIIGFDFSLTFLVRGLLDEDEFSSLLRRLEKSLLTLKINFVDD